MLRLDRLDSIGSGNKSFKLKYNFIRAREEGYRRLVSCGGAYSNHLHALALMGCEQGFETVGVIRGDADTPLNPTLLDATSAGMMLHYVNRSDYAERATEPFVRNIEKRFPGSLWIPEGGSNLEGVRGCMEIADYLPRDCELVVLPCGTAATLAGIAAGLWRCRPGVRVLGIAVLKQGEFLEEAVGAHHRELQSAGLLETLPDNWSIEHRFHGGGYAKIQRPLGEWLCAAEKEVGIALEPIYSGKMFYAVRQMISAGELSHRGRIALIHTGGMQGLRGMQTRLQRFSVAPADNHLANY